MKKIALLLALIFGFTNVAFASSAIDPVTNKPLSVSYVQTSGTAILKPVDAKAGNYTLTMNVAPYITYFSDRPNRVIGKIPTTDFISKWKQGTDNFSQDAPNAVLSGVIQPQQKDKSINIIMEISNPTYDQTKQLLTYQVHILSNGKPISYPYTTLTYPTLFIDSDPCISCMIR